MSKAVTPLCARILTFAPFLMRNIAAFVLLKNMQMIGYYY